MKKRIKIINVHDFPRLLGNCGKLTEDPPKLCASLAQPLKSTICREARHSGVANIQEPGLRYCQCFKNCIDIVAIEESSLTRPEKRRGTDVSAVGEVIGVARGTLGESCRCWRCYGSFSGELFPSQTEAQRRAEARVLLRCGITYYVLLFVPRDDCVPNFGTKYTPFQNGNDLIACQAFANCTHHSRRTTVSTRGHFPRHTRPSGDGAGAGGVQELPRRECSPLWIFVYSVLCVVSSVTLQSKHGSLTVVAGFLCS